MVGANPTLPIHYHWLITSIGPEATTVSRLAGSCDGFGCTRIGWEASLTPSRASITYWQTRCSRSNSCETYLHRRPSLNDPQEKHLLDSSTTLCFRKTNRS